MNLNHLLYFRTLAQYEHYHKASEVLHITQPSLSNAIHHLEVVFRTPKASACEVDFLVAVGAFGSLFSFFHVLVYLMICLFPRCKDNNRIRLSVVSGPKK